jgi:GcrA cell cycle regulator
MGELTTQWTDARMADLRKYWAQDYSCSQIASLLGGVTRNAVIGKVHRLGLSGRTKEVRPQRPPREPVIRRIVIRQPSFVRVEEPPLRCVETAPRNVALLDLEPEDCRYPVTDDSPFLFCGHQIAEGSYCRAHYRIAMVFTPPTLTRAEQLQKRREYKAQYRASKRVQSEAAT